MNRLTGQIALIINADDLGWTEGVNEGILRAGREGIVTSATLAANMPAAEAAVEAVKALVAEPSPVGRSLGIGVHLNACQGPALSALGRETLAGGDGIMRHTAGSVLRSCLLRPRRTLPAIRAEFQAQIEWCLRRGLTPTHADSHRHLHAWPAVFRLVTDLCREYDIPFVRRFREPVGGHHRGWCPLPPAKLKQRLASQAMNLLGRRCERIAPDRWATRGTLGVAHTGGITVAFLLAAIDSLEAGATEIMVHPGYAHGLSRAETRLLACREAEMRALCDERVRRRIEERKVVLTHYGELR